MSTRSKLALAIPVLLLLSACEDEPEVSVEDDGREASGAVLEGSIRFREVLEGSRGFRKVLEGSGRF